MSKLMESFDTASPEERLELEARLLGPFKATFGIATFPALLEHVQKEQAFHNNVIAEQFQARQAAERKTALTEAVVTMKAAGLEVADGSPLVEAYVSLPVAQRPAFITSLNAGKVMPGSTANTINRPATGQAKQDELTEEEQKAINSKLGIHESK